MRDFDLRQGMQIRPTLDDGALGVEEFPAHRAGDAEAAIIGRAAANTHDATFRAGLRGILENFAEAEGIQLERVKFAAR